MAKLQRLGVLKTSAFLGLFSVFIGFLFAIFAWIVTSVISSMLIPSGSGVLSSTNELGIIYFIIIPPLYGIFGFIGGLILVPIANLILKMIKGIDLGLEVAGQVY